MVVQLPGIGEHGLRHGILYHLEGDSALVFPADVALPAAAADIALPVALPRHHAQRVSTVTAPYHSGKPAVSTSSAVFQRVILAQPGLHL